MRGKTHFDYIIIGNGLAGLQLALAMTKEPYFNSLQIALIDPSEKSTNDKTWSFWEKGNSQFDAIVEKKWKTAEFKSPDLSLQLPLENYVYKTVRALSFYDWAKEQLKDLPNFQFILDKVVNVEEFDKVKVTTTHHFFTADHIFDSRIPQEYQIQPNDSTIIHQHFIGWVIETETPCFDPSSFTMMDYCFQYKNSTSFIYVLPFSETKALVEYTFFTPFLVERQVYEKAIKSYISQEFNLDHYKIVEKEVGNIPMTDFPFWKYNTDRITKIGTGGGWVKGSTGYSFKHTEKKVGLIIKNIKQAQLPSKGLVNRKFKFYDKIFLKVLHDENHKGVWIFERFYSKNTVPAMFKFLDEETTFVEDLGIMKSLFSFAFIKAFFKVLFRAQ